MTDTKALVGRLNDGLNRQDGESCTCGDIYNEGELSCPYCGASDAISKDMHEAATEITRLQDELDEEKEDMAGVISSNKNIGAEYNQLAIEYSQLQAELDVVMELLEFADELLSREIDSYGEPGALWLKKTKAFITKQAKP